MTNETIYVIVIAISVILAIIWAIFNTIVIMRIEIKTADGYFPEDKLDLVHSNKFQIITEMGEKISRGANVFLFQEYAVMSVFIAIFSVIVFLSVDYFGQPTPKFRFYATGAYIVGSITSILIGFLGMRIAVSTNYRTTYLAMSSLEEAFRVAFRAGCVMGFTSMGIGLGVLLALILIFKSINNPILDMKNGINSYVTLFELIAAYGLGGSSMALFGRVGGGIYTKAADVGADLVGKLEEGLDEDSPRNPATIADNVGDNVGDIAGMGSDLFGSFAESTCAALVLIASSPVLLTFDSALIYYPLLISSAGIFAGFLSSIFGIYLYKVNTFERIQMALIYQLILSAFLTILMIIPLIYIFPTSWIQSNDGIIAQNYYPFICTSSGLISGLLIGISTNYFTSNNNSPVQEMARSCSSGAAINIIFGLALGYNSTIIPVILIAITLLVSIILMGMLGVALSAIGMLSTLTIALAIDVYGPISDNAGGIAEMSGLGEEVRRITDALDAAGNTTAAVGKGFAIGSAALVSLALFGAFVTRAKSLPKNPLRSIELTNPWIFASLLIGAMLPYAFSALTMKAVGEAAKEMVAEVRRQFKNPAIREGRIEPDYETCIKVSTNASLKKMILPGLIVIITPLFFGVVFHPSLVAGLLPGALISGIQLAISMSNTGGAWDNTKKFIESGNFMNEHGVVKKKGSDEHKAAVIGDTVGDPLKDTSGPSLNILIKLMAIISLVFAGGFSNTSFLAKYLNIQQK